MNDRKCCEEERAHEVWSTGTGTNSNKDAVVHRTYSCVLSYCSHPERKCRVKGNAGDEDHH
jgi:hypothetical protein